jgi:hypothetical protein
MTVAAITIATTTVKGDATAKISLILVLIVSPVWLGFGMRAVGITLPNVDATL